MAKDAKDQGKGGGKSDGREKESPKKQAKKPKFTAPAKEIPPPLEVEQSFLSRHSGTLFVLFLIGVIFLSGGRVFFGGGKPPNQLRQTAEQKAAIAAAIGGPFSLIDHLGRAVSEADFKGRFMLIYFGYTYCPDVCPTALTNISAVLDDLGEAGEKIAPIFISVDPARDTSEHLKEYLTHFHPRIIGLTGAEAEIKAAAKAYKVFYKKDTEAEAHAHAAGGAHSHDADDQDYDVDHASVVFLMGPDGVYRTRFSHATSPEDMIREIRKFL